MFIQSTTIKCVRWRFRSDVVQTVATVKKSDLV